MGLAHHAAWARGDRRCLGRRSLRFDLVDQAEHQNERDAGHGEHPRGWRKKG
jgi:hypothetical protein